MKEEIQDDSSRHSNHSLSSEAISVDKDFVKAYKNLPELWDSQHEHYTNKYKRNIALDSLLKVMKRWNPSATRVNVRQKINILRSSYRKDLRKHLASKRIGPNGEETYDYNPTNWKFYALRFLENDRDNAHNALDYNEIVEINVDDHNFKDEASTSCGPYKQTHDENPGSTSENDESSSHSSDILAEEKPAQKKNSNTKNKRLKLVDEDEYLARNNDLLDRELKAIGANVTCKLKRMDPLQRYHAELLINKVLISGLKNNLSDDTDLTDVYRP